MAEACLFMLTRKTLLGINIQQLKSLGVDEAVDWKTIPSLPHSFFSIDPPYVDECSNIFHFVHDSKFYMVDAGSILPVDVYYHQRDIPVTKKTRVGGGGSIKGTIDYIDPTLASYKIYQLDMDKKEFITADDSFPPAPTPLAPCFMGNISSRDAVYMLVYHGGWNSEIEGLWCLSSSMHEWKRLLPPPPLLSENTFKYSGSADRCCVFQGKLFSQVALLDGERERIWFSFDPKTSEWTQVERGFIRYVHRYYWPRSKGFIDSLCFPGVDISLPHLPALGNCSCSVALSWSFGDDDSYHRTSTLKLQALLVNNQNGDAVLYQPLHECTIQDDTSFRIGITAFSIVDLGSGMLCALIHGRTHHRRTILFISVFTLTAAATINVDDIIGDDTTEALPKEQRFLHVALHVRRVFNMDMERRFNMEDDGFLWMLDPFVFSPKRELPQEKEGTMISYSHKS